MNQRDLVVEIARKEVGNVGGEPYWRWYGFNHRVEWCACFASWVLAQAGVNCGDLRPYINKTDTPEEADAIESFIDGEYDALISKGCMQMMEFYTGKNMRIGDVPAQPGDIVLYEWDPNGRGALDGVDHVGIVDWVEGDDPNTQLLHLIEGNWGNKVCRTTYEYRDPRVWAICRPNYRDVGVTFGEAIEAVKAGKKAARLGWNGKNQYIELAMNISYKTMDGVVVNVDHDAIGNKAIAFVGTSGVQIGWLASQADMLSSDWIVF